jgi:hypothetical protein
MSNLLLVITSLTTFLTLSFLCQLVVIAMTQQLIMVNLLVERSSEFSFVAYFPCFVRGDMFMVVHMHVQ